MAKQGEKIWPKFEVEYAESPSPDEAGRTDVAFKYDVLGSRPRPSHYATVGWNRIDADGVAGVKAAWASVVAAMAKHGVSINATGRTTLTNVPNKVTHQFYRALNSAVKQITKWGEDQSRKFGRSAPVDKDN